MQTDFPVDMLEQFVLENPQRVLALLGVTALPPPMLPPLPPLPPPPPCRPAPQETELVYTMPSAYSVRRLATSVSELGKLATGNGNGHGAGPGPGGATSSRRAGLIPASRSLQTFFFSSKKDPFEHWS